MVKPYIMGKTKLRARRPPLKFSNAAFTGSVEPVELAQIAGRTRSGDGVFFTGLEQRIQVVSSLRARFIIRGGVAVHQQAVGLNSAVMAASMKFSDGGSGE